MADPVLEPKNPTAVPPTGPELEPANAAAPAAPAEGDMPPEIIENPVMQALFAGSPPAVSMNIDAMGKQPLGQLIAKNSQLLMESGLNFYRSRQGDIGAIFNQLYIQPQQILDADQKGALTQVAPPVEEVIKAIEANPAQNPVLAASGPPGAPPSPAPDAGAAMIPAGGGGAAPQPTVQTARRRNTQLGSPTSGPAPGSGRLLNAILKPVV